MENIQTSLNPTKLKQFLDHRADWYNRGEFIPNDPIAIPHQFSQNQDIEVAGFFAAVFSWGNRTSILRSCHRLMELMDYAPYQFVREHQPDDLRRLLTFVHRTFNSTDLLYFIAFLRKHYHHHSSLEDAFIVQGTTQQTTVESALNTFYDRFFEEEHPVRTRKHIAAPKKKSACKRMNMFLRWMVRRDDRGVDFGIWTRIRPAQLVCPLDIHVARVAKRLGLLERRQTDWRAALELTNRLREFCPQDPVRYDYALFGIGQVERLR